MFLLSSLHLTPPYLILRNTLYLLQNSTLSPRTPLEKGGSTSAPILGLASYLPLTSRIKSEICLKMGNEILSDHIILLWFQRLERWGEWGGVLGEGEVTQYIVLAYPPPRPRLIGYTSSILPNSKRKSYLYFCPSKQQA